MTRSVPVPAICSDCQRESFWQQPSVIARGSSIREPGESLCRSCSATRSKLVRELDRMPSDIHTIRSMRMR